MVIGIDASRGNEAHRTGTEWYSFHLINKLKSIIPSTETVILYSKEPLRGDWATLPPNWSSKVLGWKPGLLWTQLRLSWEMLWHAPDVLFVPAHTIPFIHPKTVLVAHDIGFEQKQRLYGSTTIGEKTVFGRILGWLVRLITLGHYGTSELDYHRWAMRFGIKHACRIITISEFSKQEMLKTYHLDPKQIQVIWHALPNEASTITPIKSVHSTKPIILYVGRIEEKKNLGLLVEALQLIPQTLRPKIVLVGKDGLGAEQIKQRVKDLHLETSVLFTGYLAESAVQEWRNKATAMILPSRYEGFGLPILEAWRAHLPMITSRIPALQEVGGEAVAYFELDSPQDCALVIQAVIANQNLRTSLIHTGEARLKLFSLDRMANQTYEVIRQCATIPS